MASAEAPAVERLSVEAAKPKIAAVYEEAAVKNIALRSEMNWAFGGKSQRGWSLYAPLISSTIGADLEEGTGASFALRLSRWQQVNGLQATGILDDKTWFQMIKRWQSSRIKDRTFPTEESLVTAPVRDFYDPTREEDLRRVERRTFLAYKRMVQAAIADSTLGLLTTRDGELAAEEQYFKIISAYRSRQYQDQLRKQSPGSGRAALAVNSLHQTGKALDIYVGGEPVSTKDYNRAIQVNTRAYRWLVKNAARFGFAPYFYEPWHWEYVGN
jgi:uncharacterized protein YcbK (DUF882 family)